MIALMHRVALPNITLLFSPALQEAIMQGSLAAELSYLLDMPHTAFQARLFTQEIKCSLGFACPSPSVNHLEDRYIIKHDQWEAPNDSFGWPMLGISHQVSHQASLSSDGLWDVSPGPICC